MVGYRYTPSEYPVEHFDPDEPNKKYTINAPERSEWECVVFGDVGAEYPLVVFTPLKGQAPNWFHRKMQELCFGFKWRKK
jgi:hypothetical protein